MMLFNDEPQAQTEATPEPPQADGQAETPAEEGREADKADSTDSGDAGDRSAD